MGTAFTYVLSTYCYGEDGANAAKNNPNINSGVEPLKITISYQQYLRNLARNRKCHASAGHCNLITLIINLHSQIHLLNSANGDHDINNNKKQQSRNNKQQSSLVYRYEIGPGSSRKQWNGRK